MSKNSDIIVNKICNDNGFKWIGEKYINNRTKIKVKCIKGHIDIKTLGCIKRNGCRYCSNKYKKTDEEVQNICFDKGFMWIDKEYKNKDSILEVECENGHITLRTFGNIRKGHGCMECVGSIKKTDDEVHKFCNLKGFKWIGGKYKGVNENIKVKCKNNHITYRSLGNMRNKGCNLCNIYKNEEECRKIFESLYKCKFPKKKPKFLQGLEFDGYNKELCIAFEYQGVQHYKYNKHFHRSLKCLEKQKERDERKKMTCEEYNIRLYEIPYTVKFENLENYINTIAYVES